MGATWVTLVRHGETDDNRRGRYQGRRSGGLSPLGRRQAERAGARLAGRPVDALYSSPLERSRETASCLSGPLGMPVIEEPGFLEIDMGPWEGRDRSEVAAEDPERWRLWLTDPTRVRVPGMEPVEDLRARVGGALDRLVERHPGGRVVVVTHFACVVTAVLHALGLPSAAYRRFQVDNASLTVLRCAGRGTLMRFNDTAHRDVDREPIAGQDRSRTGRHGGIVPAPGGQGATEGGCGGGGGGGR